MNFIQKIDSRKDPYMIAEIGINHNGSLPLAMEMIDAAVESGADCVKFQSFIADAYISKRANKASYQNVGAYAGRTQNELIKECELSTESLSELISYGKKKGVEVLSTPFEVLSLRALVDLGLPALKISSCNLTNIPFLHEVADQGLPVLLSTGMASLNEVIIAYDILNSAGCPTLVLQCTSNYPAKVSDANLNVLLTYQKLFGCVLGFSDHSDSNVASIAAVALGAKLVEKHFTLSRSLPGIDQGASVTPDEFKLLVSQLRECRSALGSHVKKPSIDELDTSKSLRRSLVATRNILAGECLAQDSVAIMRPGTGIPPGELQNLIGKKLARNVEEGAVLIIDDFMMC